MRRKIASPGVLLAVLVACRPAAFDPFPSGAEAAGWTKSRTRTFEASELWRYLNGDADRYLAAGIERTLTADYRHPQGAEAVVDVHVMSNGEAARRILESESAAGSQAIGVGEQGRSYGLSVIFRRERCLVRLTAYEDTAVARAALMELARAVDARLQRRRP